MRGGERIGDEPESGEGVLVWDLEGFWEDGREVGPDELIIEVESEGEGEQGRAGS